MKHPANKLCLFMILQHTILTKFVILAYTCERFQVFYGLVTLDCPVTLLGLIRRRTYPTIQSLSEIHCARCNYDMWKAEEVSSRAFWSSTTIRRGTVTGTNEKKSFKNKTRLSFVDVEDQNLQYRRSSAFFAISRRALSVQNFCDLCSGLHISRPDFSSSRYSPNELRNKVQRPATLRLRFLMILALLTTLVVDQ